MAIYTYIYNFEECIRDTEREKRKREYRKVAKKRRMI
jgi:hypothetical protein